MPSLNLNEGVPRTFHSARNLNARVTCFENILPGSCTENMNGPYGTEKKKKIEKTTMYNVHVHVHGDPTFAPATIFPAMISPITKR